ncbi:hypothetical protein [Thermincola ferriacetica]
MDFNNVIRLMGQQLDALKNIEDLLSHDEKQNPTAHTVKPEEVNHLKEYVYNTKRAAETAKGLAEYYKNLGQPVKTENKETAEQSGQAENGNATEQTEKPKPKRSRKKTETPKPKRSRKKTETPAEPPAEPASNEPADAKNPASQVPVTAPEPTPEPKPVQQNILDLIASISIDNLQS